MSISRESKANPDILFLNATVIDGSARPRYLADVHIQNGLIHSIREHPSTHSLTELDDLGQTSTRIIDCANSPPHGWILCPGFIDMHAHSDLSLLHTPIHAAKITQGVTTEVIGQDGVGYAPVDDRTLARIRKQIAGWNGNPSTPGFFDRWRSVREYLDLLDAEGASTNAAYLVPQGNLRALVIGWENRPATLEEVEQMKALLREGLEQGAVGMSSGLTYVPGMFASTQELEALCEVVAEFGGYFCPHTRSYGKGALEAYEEMIGLALRTGVRLHLTHCVMNFAENEGRAGELVEMIDRAIEEGVVITLDSYPYLPGSTTLAATLPSWVVSADDPAAILKDLEQLSKIKHQCLVEGTDGCSGCTLDWTAIEISGVGDPSLSKAYVGKTILQISKDQASDPFDVYVKILLEDSLSTTILKHVGHEANVRTMIRHPTHTGSTDGILTSTKPHPRGWGTFPRYLGHYARDLPRGRSRRIYDPESTGEFDAVQPDMVFAGEMEEAVAHLTSRAAAVVGLKDRGLVRKGWKADLVLFDAENIRDAATFAQPEREAEGIRLVVVNGVVVFDKAAGGCNGVRAGRTIRGSRDGKDGKWAVG